MARFLFVLPVVEPESDVRLDTASDSDSPAEVFGLAGGSPIVGAKLNAGADGSLPRVSTEDGTDTLFLTVLTYTGAVVGDPVEVAGVELDAAPAAPDSGTTGLVAPDANGAGFGPGFGIEGNTQQDLAAGAGYQNLLADTAYQLDGTSGSDAVDNAHMSWDPDAPHQFHIKQAGWYYVNYEIDFDGPLSSAAVLGFTAGLSRSFGVGEGVTEQVDGSIEYFQANSTLSARMKRPSGLADTSVTYYFLTVTPLFMLA